MDTPDTRTVKRQPICHRLAAANVMMGAVVTLLSNLFKRMRHIGSSLKSAGATFADVVMINSFHVWEGPNFEGTKEQHFAAFEEVADTYLKPPYPAWTAVGTTGLLGTNSIVEVQLIAQVPKP